MRERWVRAATCCGCASMRDDPKVIPLFKEKKAEPPVVVRVPHALVQAAQNALNEDSADRATVKALEVLLAVIKAGNGAAVTLKDKDGNVLAVVP